MGKIADFLLKVFMWILSLIYCSLALPLALGLLWLIGDIAFDIREGFNNTFGVWQNLIYLIVGMFIKILWLDKWMKKDKK
jgi:hypothetical protein